MPRNPSDLAASVRARLLRLSRERKEDFNRILNRYAIERLLYRLSQSRHRDQFVLKGATLLLPLVGAVYRPTRDVDLLNLDSPDSDRVMQVFRELCELSVEPDGLSFDSDTIRLETIRENQPYPNHRVKFEASLAGAIIVVQVDVAFGDAIATKLEKVVFPGLLDLPESKVLAYPKEAVIAEKLEAIVSLGVANSRMKDYYDLSIFSKTFEFNGTELTQAMRATFEKRRSLVPSGVPYGLTDQFGELPDKAGQWLAFLRRSRLGIEPFQIILNELRSFLMPPLDALMSESEFNCLWRPGGPWRERKQDSPT